LRRTIRAVLDDNQIVAAGALATDWSLRSNTIAKAESIAVRWLYEDRGAHLSEAATIAARETRVSRGVALFDLKDDSRLAFSWGQPSYDDAVNAIRNFQAWAVESKDPFFSQHHLTEAETANFVDRRFFAGGEYFVDTAQH
jgi:sulfonate transport system substrate-binding protein